MSNPISVRLADDVRRTLEEEARAAYGHVGVPAGTGDEAARRIRRERVRAQSRAVGAYVASSPEARAFYEEISDPAGDES